MARHETWMPLYVGDYLADTMHLTTRQHGAYLLLLMHAWRSDGFIPHKAEALAAIVRMPVKEWLKDATAVLDFFDQDPSGERGYYVHLRVMRELSVAHAMTEQRSKAGKASAAKRERERQRNGNEISTPVEQALPSRTRPSQIPSPSPDLTTTPSVSNSAPAGASHTPRSELITEKWEPSETDKADIIKQIPWLANADLYAKRMADFRDWCVANATRSFNPAATWRGFMRKTPEPRISFGGPKINGQAATQARTDEPWEWRVSNFRKDGFWQPTWGPPPGQPGCFAPKEFLQ